MSTTLAAPPRRRFTMKREIITPEVATKWLERNEGNRNISQTKVEEYARDMRASRWHLTGDPIQFGLSGKLLNGQHRLWACIESDMPFECVIVRGIENEEEVADVIDTGLKRTLSNALQIHGEADTNVLASIIATCWQYERNRCTGRRLIPSHLEGLEWLRENPQARDAVRVARAAHSMIKATTGPAGSAYYLNSRADAEAAAEFWERASTGANLASGDPILAYRRWVVGVLGKRDKPGPYTWLAYNLKAMNQWRAGKSVRILVVKPDEPMPEAWS